jgi:hypothetical protein
MTESAVPHRWPCSISESRDEERSEQTKLAAMLAKYLEPGTTLWTSLHDEPFSRLSGCDRPRCAGHRGRETFVELKSHRGVAPQ